jgi:hypothetical protein
MRAVSLLADMRTEAFRARVLPLLLGALVLRAMIPMGYMPADGMSLSAAMCSMRGGTESIEMPGTGTVHCDYCVAPPLCAPPAPPTITVVARIHSELAPARHEAPAPRFALQRAQIPRAPPV